MNPSQLGEDSPDSEAWLERSGEASLPVGGSFSMGRGATNSLVLRTEGVSRCHAVIHRQSNGEFWIIDLGSCNGTWLNDQRILQPVRLQDRDQIQILQHRLVFRQRIAGDDAASDEWVPTIPVQRLIDRPFWLLIADIEDFTRMSQTLTSWELGAQVGQWLRDCQAVVERKGGRINKYLGDGFFAVWPDNEGSEHAVADALKGLSVIHQKGTPSFRMVVHRGVVAVGGSPLLAEESFIGSEVNFTFRMEKLAGSLGVPLLVSQPAQSKLGALLSFCALPAQRLKGFEESYSFFVPQT